MYSFKKTAEVRHISLTGARLIVILGALMTAPRDLEELNQILTKCGLVDKGYSKDTIRIVLSTLKAMDYKIQRPCKATNMKYALLDYPLLLKITEDEYSALKAMFNNITKEGSFETVIAFEKLLNTFASNISDEEMIKKLYEIPSYKQRINDNVYKTITSAKQNQVLTVTYRRPGSRKPVSYSLIFGKLFLKTNRLYLKAQDIETNYPIVLSVLRIIEANLVQDERTYVDPDVCTVKYVLKNPNKHILPEKSFYTMTDANKTVITSEFVNQFFAIQYLMERGSDCTVLEPLEVREKMINQLRGLKQIYEQN